MFIWGTGLPLLAPLIRSTSGCLGSDTPSRHHFFLFWHFRRRRKNFVIIYPRLTSDSGACRLLLRAACCRGEEEASLRRKRLVEMVVDETMGMFGGSSFCRCESGGQFFSGLVLYGNRFRVSGTIPTLGYDEWTCEAIPWRRHCGSRAAERGSCPDLRVHRDRGERCQNQDGFSECYRFLFPVTLRIRICSDCSSRVLWRWIRQDTRGGKGAQPPWNTFIPRHQAQRYH